MAELNKMEEAITSWSLNEGQDSFKDHKTYCLRDWTDAWQWHCKSPQISRFVANLSGSILGAGPIAPAGIRSELDDLSSSSPLMLQFTDRLRFPPIGVYLARCKTFRRVFLLLPRWRETWVLQPYGRNGHSVGDVVPPDEANQSLSVVHKNAETPEEFWRHWKETTEKNSRSTACFGPYMPGWGDHAF